MKLHTSDAMTRPLFEEPSADSEREDEWSWPKGFMFGGWSLPSGTTWEMAEQYFDAVKMLIEDIEQNQLEDYKVGTAILYLYRHWLELAVKSVTGPTRGHDLSALGEKLDSVCRKRGIAVPDWVHFRLKEIAAIDPDSSAFRYAEGRIDGEIYVSLPHLKQVMAALHAAFYSAANYGRFPVRISTNELETDYVSI